MFDQILTNDEIDALHAMRERIQATRPKAKGPQMTMHFAVEDTLAALAAIARGNPSSSQDLVEAGKNVRKAVLGR